ncbi:hypothetical protein D3C72_2004730 [compost metagenome]
MIVAGMFKLSTQLCLLFDCRFVGNGIILFFALKPLDFCAPLKVQIERVAQLRFKLGDGGLQFGEFGRGGELLVCNPQALHIFIRITFTVVTPLKPVPV